MNNKNFPSYVGQYHIVKTPNIPSDVQDAVLATVPRTRLDERLAVLIASGRVAVSTVVAKYHDLVTKVSSKDNTTGGTP
jgi:hypothetical protein